MSEKIFLLSVGNSFSQDAHRYLHAAALSSGIELETYNLYIGGCALERHYNNITSDARDYLLEINGESSGKMVSLSDGIKLHEWDYVTLQQVSGLSGVPQSYFPYLTELANYISRQTNSFKFLFHQTWAYEINSSHPDFSIYNNNQHEMFRRLKDCSEMASKLLEAEIIRTGEAIQNLRDNVKKFDYAGDGISLCRDGFHLSLDYGRFAAANVWLKKLTGKKTDVKNFVKLFPDVDFDPSVLELILENI